MQSALNYDRSVPYQHLVFKDWQAAIDRQAASLDGILRKRWNGEFSRVADIACGIGTQSLGLSAMGYEVSASDVSEQAVERAMREAEFRSLKIDFSVADMRDVVETHGGRNDIVIACDNAIARLPSDGEILAVLRACFNSVREGGACLLSLRDHDLVEKSGSQTHSHGIREEIGIRYRMFEVWEFDGEYYDVSMYVVVDDGVGPEEINVFKTRYYALSPNRLAELMTEAGFGDVRRIDGQYFQPIVIGTRPVV